MMMRLRFWLLFAVPCAGFVLCLAPGVFGGAEVLLFALNDSAAVESLRLHGDKASAVSPQWYSAAANGDLTGGPSQRLLDACRDLKIPVTPAVINTDFSARTAAEMLASPPARARFVRELLAAARKNSFDGYIIDFENLAPGAAGRRQFTDLLREMRAAFRPQRLSLGVALPPPSPRNRQAMDFAAAGRLADRVVLMAYDQHGRFNAPGPIAGYRWVDQTLRDTLKLVPARKLLLGVAFYHRQWGEAVTAGSYNEALVLLKEHGADWRWHPSHRSHWFAFSRAGRTHTVWVEDARSVAEKIALARRYRLAGLAGWRLGQEDARVWVMLRQFQSEPIGAPTGGPIRRTASRQQTSRHERR